MLWTHVMPEYTLLLSVVPRCLIQLTPNNSKFCSSSFPPAQSCPAIQVYSGSNVERALTLAAGSFCSQEVAVSEAERRVTTSKIFHWYASDFGSTERERLQ